MPALPRPIEGGRKNPVNKTDRARATTAEPVARQLFVTGASLPGRNAAESQDLRRRAACLRPRPSWSLQGQRNRALTSVAVNASSSAPRLSKPDDCRRIRGGAIVLWAARRERRHVLSRSPGHRLPEEADRPRRIPASHCPGNHRSLRIDPDLSGRNGPGGEDGPRIPGRQRRRERHVRADDDQAGRCEFGNRDHDQPGPHRTGDPADRPRQPLSLLARTIRLGRAR